MSIARREFLLGAAALAAPVLPGLTGETTSASTWLPPAGAPIFPPSVRADFPIASNEVYLNSAAIHPMSLPASRALADHIAFRLKGPGEGRGDFGPEQQNDLKRRFAQLIGAKADEIAFVQNTSDGENIVVMGMDLPRRGGNVVLDELHFETSLYMYKSLEAKGLELRVVKHRDWAIDIKDMERVVDRNTRLVSMALVSNVNGYLHDARAISDLAHAHGAYVFADMVQAAGAVPIDVRAMGIDFGSTATYKWLMGERGFGFLYVREDLQNTVVPTTRYGHRQLAKFDRIGITWEPLPGAARYETGTFPNALALCSHTSLQYIERLGLANIRAHARQLTDRLQHELPAMGYPSVTPKGNETPTVAFQLKDAADTARKLKRAGVTATIIEDERRLRVSVSVFNAQEDIDHLIAALS
ncbi:MAG TPA: aminotransferase class V-fold PLP-dependent enzyme [Vicinamibacterales bacterium]|nr:aminotransferase class V-fold PLP-dependent enzyme [Vicinamibacterales bacterium]